MPKKKLFTPACFTIATKTKTEKKSNTQARLPESGKQKKAFMPWSLTALGPFIFQMNDR